MSSSLRLFGVAIAVLMSQAACTAATPVFDKPSSVINLGNWKLSIPVMDSSDEHPLEIRQPELNEHSSQYMFVAGGKKEVVFQTPTHSAVQPGSEYPRTELREMTEGGQAKAKWSNTDSIHELVVEQAVTVLPSTKPSVVVGQIHDSKGFVVLIRLDGTHLYVKTEDGDIDTLDDHYDLGRFFALKITAGGGNVMVYYNNQLKETYRKKCSSCYFKAGIYLQTNADMEDGESHGEVHIRRLDVMHY
ncbi:polysaccharide lyase family 7 protein [Pseudarthrobacter oxydans]|uniref:polysaccharide lyase family 7 protein n=1 Tax=Pseudarthrobacter oxydans TaxID=1671 RepID=UPI0037F312FB